MDTNGKTPEASEKKVARRTQTAVANTPDSMIRLAIERGADLAKLEQVMKLQEQYEQNQARKAFNVAMSEFKANAPKIVKDRSVSFGSGKASYKHASLYQVAEKIAAEMSKHGLSASWRVVQNGSVAVTTRISHIQGHFEETTLSAPADISGNKNPIQAIGSTISYLQRYGLLCIAGLASADMDDDGQAAVTEYIGEKELNQLLDLIADKEADVDKFCKYMGVDALAKIPAKDYQKAFTALQNKKKPGAK